MRLLFAIIIIPCCFIACSKSDSGSGTVTPQPQAPSVTNITINNITFNNNIYNVSLHPAIKITFSQPLLPASVDAAVSLSQVNGAAVIITTTLQNHDSVLLVNTSSALVAINKYIFKISTALKSASNGSLSTGVNKSFITQIDSTDKFTRISDSALLDLVQQETFKYFWDFGHPVSGIARERNSSGDVCTTGGTGFGIMSMIVAANRNFISHADALSRIQKIVSFYKNNCTVYHGAFAHWINGATGATVPFSTKDDGADLVETSYLMQGLLCARQYFNSADADEVTLRNDINALWNAVEWNWFQQNGQNVLYWHWSPDYNWDMNFPIHGWNEALITYVLAASSNNYAIPKIVYDNGWAQNGAFANNQTYYSIQLPLGPSMGGPLFFAHYSFLGINPHDLTDAYANYWTQNTAHSNINFNYCAANTKGYYGYSNLCWGLTASDDDINGYDAHSPTNDDGVISPTAAISSLPYTPEASMNALKFFYYTLGDRLWGDYGFVDAFNLTDLWFANSFLAIDQGPEIVMIENYRSGLLWNLFMSCPEVKTGMKALGFQSPDL